MMTMARMNRYDDEEGERKVEVTNPLSRERKNQVIYDNAYLNSSVVDIMNILPLEENEQVEVMEANEEEEKRVYEEKSYDVNAYLKKAHEKHITDNAMRDLENQDFQNGEDEIRKLISAIDEKEDIEDIFSDLKGDNEDTLIGAKIKTDDFDTNIYEILKEDEERQKLGNTVLEHAIGETTIVNMQMEEEAKKDHSFDEIENQNEKPRRKKKLPWIIFTISLLVLIGLIVYILLK